MCPKLKQANRGSRRQTGNLYLVVIFVLVIFGYLANVLMQLAWSNSDALSKEWLGVQASLAARSVQELALTQLFPLAQSSAVATNCQIAQWAAVVSQARSVLADYPACAPEKLTFDCNSLGKLNDDRLYQLTARVRCGSGKFEVARGDEVWVKEAL